MSLPLIFPPVELDGQVLIDGGTMDNVPADVVKAMGAEPRHRRQRRRPHGSRERQLHDARGRRRHARRDDAGVDPPRHRRRRCRHQRAARRVRIARLAAGAGAHRGGLQRRRGDARPVAAAGGERSRVRDVAPRPPGTPPEGPAGAGVRRLRGVRRQRRQASQHPPRSPRRQAPRHRRRSRRTSPSSPGWIATRQ